MPERCLALFLVRAVPATADYMGYPSWFKCKLYLYRAHHKLLWDCRWPPMSMAHLMMSPIYINDSSQKSVFGKSEARDGGAGWTSLTFTKIAYPVPSQRPVTKNICLCVFYHCHITRRIWLHGHRSPKDCTLWTRTWTRCEIVCWSIYSLLNSDHHQEHKIARVDGPDEMKVDNGKHMFQIWLIVLHSWYFL